VITIITPTYNSSAYINETIESIIQQSFTDWKYIIIDDSSTDNTIEIVKNFCNKDQRIKLITLKKNYGAAIARNIGIKAARRKYIAFLDSDDFWHPMKLELQLGIMKERKYDFTYTDYYLVFENTMKPFRSFLSIIRYQDILKFNYIACSTVIFDQEKIGKIYMPNIRNRQDWGLWIKLLQKVNVAYNIPDFLMYYRVRKNSISSNKLKLMKYHWYIYKTFLKLPTFKALLFLTQNFFMHLIYKRK